MGKGKYEKGRNRAGRYVGTGTLPLSATPKEPEILPQPPVIEVEVEQLPQITDSKLPETGNEQKPPQKNRKGLKALLAVACVLAFLVALVFSYLRFWENPFNDYLYRKAAALYANGESALSLPEGADIKFGALYQKNKDTAGFLSVPGTKIQYPVMANNHGMFYEYFNFYRLPSTVGTPYFSKQNNLKDDTNTVIYASKQLFGPLFDYRDRAVVEANPIIEMNTLYEDSRWVIIGAYYVDGETAEDGFAYNKASFESEDDFMSYIAQVKYRSLVNVYGVEVAPTDRLLTLSAATDEFGGARFVVVAKRLTDALSEPLKIETEQNPGPVMPKKWEQAEADGTASPLPSASRSEDLSSEEASSDVSSQQATSAISTSDQSSKETSSSKTTTSNKATSAGSKASSKLSATSTTSQPVTAGTTAAVEALPTVKSSTTGKILVGSTEEILIQIVTQEIGSSSPPEALKAQTVATYSFLLYQKNRGAGTVSAPTKDEGKSSAGYKKVESAVRSVLGKRISTAKSNYPYTPYFAMSAGKTANNAETFGGNEPHLVSVDSTVDKSDSKYKVSKTYTSDDIKQRIQQKLSISLSGDPATWFSIKQRDSNGLYVLKLNIGGVEKKGRVLRETVMGTTELRSHCYDISYNASTKQFTFTSYGYGHGVGMSQTGARAYANQGKSWQWIISHYYTGVTIL